MEKVEQVNLLNSALEKEHQVGVVLYIYIYTPQFVSRGVCNIYLFCLEKLNRQLGADIDYL